MKFHEKFQSVQKLFYTSNLLKKIYLRNLLHCSNGFPVNPFGQKHIGLPLSFSHMASKPQGFGTHGLVVVSVHPTSGFPWNPGKHLH